MTSFAIGPTTGDVSEIETAALGASTSTPLTRLDKGKTVKLGADSTYTLTASGDEIEGVIASVDGVTVNGGYGIGSIQTEGCVTVVLGGTVAIGGYVVAGAQVARGTALTNYPTVIAGTPTKFLWRLVSGGTTVGTIGVIQRI